MNTSNHKNWILIRGLARGVGHWASFSAKLQKEFPNDSFYFIDIPGNGRLNHLKTPLKISGFIPFFEQQLQQQNFDSSQPTFGLSLSLGSMAMVEWAQQKPKFFEKIILMNTSAANFSNIFRRLSPTALMLGFKLAFQRKLRQREILSLQATTSLKLSQIEKDFLEDLTLIEDFSRKHSTKATNTLRQLIAAALYVFPKIAPCKTVILNGAKDRFVSPHCSQTIAQNWQTAIVIHPEAGHDISFQFPEWVIEQMKYNTKNA